MPWSTEDYTREDVYTGGASAAEISRAQRLLDEHGSAPLSLAKDGRPHGGAAILVDYLRTMQVPDHDELVRRIEAYAARPRPQFAHEDHVSVPARDVDGYHMAWIDPRRILLARPGTSSFIHDQSDSGDAPSMIDGVADMAARIAAERGSPAGLDRLFNSFHPHPGTGIMVDGWDVGSYGRVFRVNANGNHRLAAVSALGVPCVLAEVRMSTGPFTIEPPDEYRYARPESALSDYRRLLHTYGVAAIPDADGLAPVDVTTQWPVVLYDPVVASNSLAAMDALTGTAVTRVGQLPRSWFNNPQRLNTAATNVNRLLSKFLADADEYVSPVPESPGQTGQRRGRRFRLSRARPS